jgi:hypothetical protein
MKQHRNYYSHFAHPANNTRQKLTTRALLLRKLLVEMSTSSRHCENFCPILPTVHNHYSRILQPIVGELQFSLLYNCENYDYIVMLLRKIPTDARLRLCSEFLTFFLQCCWFGDDTTQSVRILNILKLCPLAACTRDSEGMTSLHHFCKRDKGICDYEILKKILEINSELPLVQNNLGESPLHQLVAQPYPDSKVIAAILTACPMACRQAIPCCGKLPLHVIISNSRLTSKRNNLEAAILVMEGYPEAAITEVFEDRPHLQGRGEVCGARNQRKWSPFLRAKEEMPQVSYHP